MQHQQTISAELLKTRVGNTIEVMVDEIDDGGAVARSHWDAPEIDGNVYVRGKTGLKPGVRLRVMVEAADDYDLWGSPVRFEAAQAPSTRAGMRAPLR
jgi:ribosomal protein S12 methylthiotransferase